MRKYISFGMLLLLAVSASASDDKTDRATLRGIKGVCTIVEVTGPGVGKDRLQVEVDGRLTGAGILVDKSATPCVYLNVRPLQAMGRNNKPIGLYAVELTLHLFQTVALTRDPSTKAYAPTWSVSNLATVPADDLEPAARQITIDLTDKFVEAFRSANPK